jgi:hypothetical protein
MRLMHGGPAFGALFARGKDAYAGDMRRMTSTRMMISGPAA